MDLIALARCFATEGEPQVVEPLGNGNINATYLVRTTGEHRYVLQRLNTAVFSRPEQVMANLEAVSRHCSPRLAAPAGERPPWQLPTPVPLRDGGGRRPPCCAMRMAALGDCSRSSTRPTASSALSTRIRLGRWAGPWAGFMP